MRLKNKHLLAFLERVSSPLSLKEIRHSLGLKKSHTAKLKAMLEKLLVMDLILENNNLYSRSSTKVKTAEKKPPHVPKSAPFVSADALVEQNIPTKVYRGAFSRSRQGYGFVEIGEGRPDIYIPEDAQGNAVNGDVVEVMPFRGKSDKRMKGRITRIVQRSRPRVLGRVSLLEEKIRVVPLQEKSNLGPIDLIAPPAESAALASDTQVEMSLLKEGDLVEVEIHPNERASAITVGHLIRIHPSTDINQLALESILIENQVRLQFPEEVQSSADKLPKKVTVSSKSKRRDLRHLPIVTIDGVTAKDFDDAIYTSKLDNGNWLLIVSIADVAEYVKAGDIIDKEAYQRGTSVYLPTFAVPMLPEALSNELCSLKPDVNRLTLTCEMEINAKGDVIRHEIYESVIRSQARLTYDEVDLFIDGSKPTLRTPQVDEMLRQSLELSEILGKKRFRRGSINFHFAETVIEFNEKQQIIGFSKRYQTRAMRLIEQFMLEANETVAKHCIHSHIPILYRVHEGPSLIKLEKLQKTFWFYQVNVKMSKLSEPNEFNLLLAQIEKLPNRDQMQLLLLKTMALACYRPTNDGHFGLAAEFYSHFTSPIRRYPDLIVHRALKSWLSEKSINHVHIYSEDQALYLSQQERRAEMTERQSKELMKVVFLQPLVGQMLQTTVLSCDAGGFTVEIAPFGLECFIPLESLKLPGMKFEPLSLSYRNEHSGEKIMVGQKIKMRLVAANPLQRTLEFAMGNSMSKPTSAKIRPARVEKTTAETRNAARKAAPKSKRPPRNRLKRGPAGEKSAPKVSSAPKVIEESKSSVPKVESGKDPLKTSKRLRRPRRKKKSL